ncbi:MAG: hypothetical protein WCF65_07905 [Parachlamydiaceae bacterium]
MIELSPATALLLYLGATLAILMGVWIASHYRAHKRRFLPPEKDLNVCEFCHFAYLDTGAKKITRCPRCDSLNKSSRPTSKF